MASIGVIIGRIFCILCSVILSILIWKTAEFFNRLPENSPAKHLIAWDVLMLFIALVFLVVRLIVM